MFVNMFLVCNYDAFVNMSLIMGVHRGTDDMAVHIGVNIGRIMSVNLGVQVGVQVCVQVGVYVDVHMGVN